jgi:predicted Fe-Mo cluster-binding NifX family protein
MLICIPVHSDAGVDSPICEHFGSSPMFLIADTESGATRTIENGDAHHAHGMCQPLAALRGQAIDALMVSGIGGGALAKLLAAGVRVFQTRHATVAQALRALEAGELLAMTPEHACAGHDHH